MKLSQNEAVSAALDLTRRVVEHQTISFTGKDDEIGKKYAAFIVDLYLGLFDGLSTEQKSQPK